jgi:hypothetical protein
MFPSTHKTPTPLPPISPNGCEAIYNIFKKYRNIDDNILQHIMSLIFAKIDENEICKRVKITKNKLYRYICYWMVTQRKNIWAKVAPRKKGKNNYNKFNAKIEDIICGLDAQLTITQLCRLVELSHATVVKYLYRFIALKGKKVFARAG